MNPPPEDEAPAPIPPRSLKETVAVAAIVLLWAIIVAALVVLDHQNYGWMAMLVYISLYFAIARVESRSRAKHGGDAARSTGGRAQGKSAP